MDICPIYAMISFLAVVVLSKVYIGTYAEKRKTAEDSDTDTSANVLEKGDMSHGNH